MTADSQRVVVTGMGWITPLGHDLDTVWNRMMNGDTGIAPIDRFDGFADSVLEQTDRHEHTGHRFGEP